MARTVVLLLMFLVCSRDGRTQEVLRFAWLTDSHVGSETGEADLRAAVADVNARPGIAFVVLSGDVTEMGTNAQVDRAHAVLAELRVPLHLIPGNHDTKWSPSGGTYLPRLFGSDRFTFEAGGMFFIGLHQGPPMRMSDGHWAPEDLRWLDSAVISAGTRPLLFVTHYPLDSGISNWYEALARLRGTKVQAILVGHGHANGLMDFEGIPGVMARALLRDRTNPPGYTIVECRPDSILCSEVPLGEEPPRRWAGIPRRSVPYHGGDGPRPSFAMNDMWPMVRQAWEVRTGYTIACRPAVAGDLCIVGCSSGEIRALSLKDGVLRWSFTTRGPVFSSPDTGMGLVVFGSADGSVYALEASTGRERWRSSTPEAVVAAPCIAGSTVYIGGSDGHLRALSLSDGQQLWRSDSIGGFIEARPAVTESLVIVGAWDGFLYAFGRYDGRMRWHWQGDRPGPLYAPAACAPIVADGKVFVVAPDRAMTCLELETGRQLWRSRRHQVRESIGASPDGTTVFVRTMRDSIVALDATSPDGAERWSSHVGFGYDLNPAPPVMVGSTVVYGTMKGLVFALGADTGSLHWQHRVGVSLVDPVVPLDERRFLIADMDGVVQVVTVGERP
jgi:outer membrane protein assembly factor BamB